MTLDLILFWNPEGFSVLQGQGTEFVLGSIEFNAAIPDYVFCKASLR